MPDLPRPDAARPLLLAYVRAHILMTETELADIKERLAFFAHRGARDRDPVGSKPRAGADR